MVDVNVLQVPAETGLGMISVASLNVTLVLRGTSSIEVRADSVDSSIAPTVDDAEESTVTTDCGTSKVVLASVPDAETSSATTTTGSFLGLSEPAAGLVGALPPFFVPLFKLLFALAAVSIMLSTSDELILMAELRR